MPLFGFGRPSPEKLKAAGDVQALSALLVDKDERLRAEALDALIDLATEPSLRQHNHAALAALGGASRPLAVRRLTELLDGISAVEAGWRNSAVAEALVALGETDTVVGYYDARAGGGLDSGLFMLDVLNLLTLCAMSRRDRTLLRRLLERGSYDYREAQGQRSSCFAHLGAELGEKPVWRAMEVMAEIGDERDLLELAERARSEAVRHWSWDALGTGGVRAALPILLQAAETGGQHGRWALASLIPSLTVDELIPLARDRRAEISEAALLQLCRRDDPAAFEMAIAAASSPTEKVSLAGIEALARTRRNGAVPALARLLRAPSAPVWKAAAAALGAIGAEEAITAMLALDAERLLDEAVLSALTAAGAGRRLLEAVAPRFVQLTPEQTLELVGALRRSLPAAEIAGLQQTLAGQHVAALADPAWGKRRNAIKALGRIGGRAAAEALRARQAQEEDYELSKEIGTALAEAEG